MFLKGMSKLLKYTWWSLMYQFWIGLKYGFFVNTKQMHKHNFIFNKMVTKIVTILTKCFFPYLNTSSYLKVSSKSFEKVYLFYFCFLLEEKLWSYQFGKTSTKRYCYQFRMPMPHFKTIAVVNQIIR